jgi:phosphatidylglycerophosphate synthase
VERYRALSIKRYKMKKNYTLEIIKNSQDLNKIKLPYLSKYFFIPIALPITWLFLKMNISPNQATFLRLLICILSYLLIIYGYDLIGYILVYIAITLDYVDGQIARVLDKASYFGNFLDGWVDCIYEITLPLIIAFSLYRMNDGVDILIYGILAGLMNALYWISLIRYSLYRPFIKKYNFSKLHTYVSNYLDNYFLNHWFDIKYLILLFTFVCNILEYFLLFLLISNTLIFIIYSLQRIYEGYYLLKVHKISRSANKNI